MSTAEVLSAFADSKKAQSEDPEYQKRKESNKPYRANFKIIYRDNPDEEVTIGNITPGDCVAAMSEFGENEYILRRNRSDEKLRYWLLWRAANRGTPEESRLEFDDWVDTIEVFWDDNYSEEDDPKVQGELRRERLLMKELARLQSGAELLPTQDSPQE